MKIGLGPYPTQNTKNLNLLDPTQPDPGWPEPRPTQFQMVGVGNEKERRAKWSIQYTKGISRICLMEERIVYVEL